jgi:integrase
MGVRVREKPLGSGVFWVFINHNGKRKARKIGTDEKKANEVAEKIKAKIVLQDFNIKTRKKSTELLFKNYSKTWLEAYIKPLREASTYERYEGVLRNHVNPSLGSKPLDQVKRSDIKNLVLKLHQKGLSKSSLELVRDVISGPMGYAIDEEILAANPVTGIFKHLKLERDRKLTKDPLTYEEVDLFLECCQKHFADYYEFFLCAFRTGMRLGELLGLKWGDVDFNSKFILVQRSYKRGHLGKTKTGKTRRVDMSDQLLAALKRLQTERKKQALKHGLGEPVEIIFHQGGNHMEQNFVNKLFKRILKKAGIRELNFHYIRHTYASLLLSNGESPVYVKEQLGHSKIGTTVDIYGHLIPNANREAVNRLDNLQPSATQAQPAKMENPQPIEITGNS